MLRNATNAAKKAVVDFSSLPKAGDKLHGFTLLRTKHVPELELSALHLRHDKTGADYLHIARDDSNNVFSIGFRTNPPDDTGVPHILEHTTLCGSHKYPVRDPFFKMMPRTLSNFMNAFTASNHTFYPFATTNAQDFRNLMSVYLDATLNPLLKEFDFFQEGWRIGPENPQAISESKEGGNKLAFKGVVYNEMKGQMSDAGYLFYVRFLDHIFPSINNSGGDPQKITDLTYEQLRKYHADHYHPSNAKVFTYGDMPLEEHLKEVDARLSPFDKIDVDNTIPVPIDLSSGAREVTEYGPLDPLVDADKQHKTSISWIVTDTANVLESFSLSLLSSLLMDGYGSPLYKGLVEEGLGVDWSPNSGYDGDGKLGMFSVGLTGVQEADVPKVKERIREILRETRQKGFDRAKIDGALHQLEIALKHKKAKFGMSLLHRLKSKWFVGVDPLDSLAWNDTIAAFEAEYAKGDYFERLMDKHLLNDNTFTFTMAPSPTFTKEIIMEEEERLAKKMAEAAGAQADTQIAKFFAEQELGLLAEQNKTNSEDLSCLPTVRVGDISRLKEPLVVRDENADGLETQWVEAPTNGLTYFRLINVLENIPDELRELIPLFADSIMRLGTKDKTMEQLEDLIKLKTGGVSIGYHSTPSPTDSHHASEGIIFTGMALDRHVPAMLDIMRTLVLETDFDSTEAALRIRQLLQASATGVVSEIASSGHAFARGYAASGLTRDAWLSQQVGGLSQVKLVTTLAGRPETDGLADVIEKLKRIQLFVLAGTNVRAAITCGTDAVDDNTASIKRFMASRPRGSSTLSGGERQPLPRDLKSFFPLPYQVYYGGLALPTVSYASSDSAPLSLLAQLLTHKHLHHEIREKGGAYGGGAYSSALGGIFGFYSYRDPNPTNTLRIMRNAGRWAVDKDWTDRDLEEAKISVFQQVDAPRAINSRGMDRFLSGITEDMKQRRREQLLDATKDQIREVAQRYLVGGLAKQSERVAFLGDKQAWVDETWTVNELDIMAAE